MIKQRLLNLFQDNAKSGAGFKIQNGEKSATIYIYDAIGGFFGIVAKDFVKELAAISAPVIHLRINSPGGDVFDAAAIKTVLEQHQAKIIAHIDGLAASAATVVALGASEIEISDGGFFMIHNAWTLAMGNATELRDSADLLEKVDASLVRAYQAKTKLPPSEIIDYMKAETWFSAAQAVDLGFVDRIAPTAAVSNAFNLTAYDHTPKALTVVLDDKNIEDIPSPDWAALERRLALTERHVA